MTITRRPTVPTRSWMTEGLTAGSTEAIETATGSKCQLVLHAPRRPTVPKKLDDGGADSRIYRSNRNCDWIKMQIGFARTTAADRTQTLDDGGTDSRINRGNRNCNWIKHHLCFEILAQLIRGGQPPPMPRDSSLGYIRERGTSNRIHFHRSKPMQTDT